MDIDEAASRLGGRFNVIAADGTRALETLELPKGAKVLDVGTGAGNFAIFLALQGYDVVTGEPATDQTHYAGKDWALNADKVGVKDSIAFQPFDASDMPFAPGTFDAVFFFGVLHHIDEGVRADVFREALRVVKPGSAVAFFEPSAKLLETIKVDDPTHPPAARPSEYTAGLPVSENRLQGEMMDIYIYTAEGLETAS